MNGMRVEILWLILGLAVPAVISLVYARLVTGWLWSSLAGFLSLLIAVAMVVIAVLESSGALR